MVATTSSSESISILFIWNNYYLAKGKIVIFSLLNKNCLLPLHQLDVERQNSCLCFTSACFTCWAMISVATVFNHWDFLLF